MRKPAPNPSRSAGFSLRLIFLCLSLPAFAALEAPKDFRLPETAAPRHYSASLTIDPAQSAFAGSIQIEIELRAPTTVIWLNAKELTDITATVTAQGRTHPAHASPVDDEFLALELDAPIGPGPATLSLTYKGQLRETPTVGAFHTNFENHWYAFTTFTAIDARRAFPCFDEPRFKTVWQLTLHIPAADQAFSNTRQTSESGDAGGTKAIHFAPTPLLASEVIAFAVGPFGVLDAGRAGSKHVPVRIVTPAGHESEGAAAAHATPGIMSGLERYMGTAYPWAKLDDVALPQGTFGGVEQPGMITYRMRGLLKPAEDTGLRSLLTHELVHQWFGNLVTQSTWRDVWLSEGFATWLTFHLTDPAHLNAIAARERIMTADAGPKTRPVRLEMHSRDEMKDIYSQFVYQKAGAILMMLEGWLGEEPFQKGLRRYVAAHANGTASTEDLASIFPGAAPVLATFLDRTGIPNVQAGVRCDPGTVPVLTVEPSAGPIPICWKGDKIPTQCAVFEAGPQERKLNRCPAWIYPNAGGTGYYRTRLDPATLTGHLADLTPAERMTLVYDLRAMGDKGPLLSALATDSEPAIATAAAAALK